MLYDVIYEDIGLKDYKETWDYQDEIFRELIRQKTGPAADNNGGEYIPGRVIFVEHPHVYTLGKSGSENNLLINYIQLQANNASFYRIDRGGDITYHGPGQLVGYPIFDLEKMGISLKTYIHGLEEAVIQTLLSQGITAGRLEGATGVWLDAGEKPKARKICAIGVRASRYVTMHGFALNINTDLSYFSHINPCGFTDKGVTSVCKETGSVADMNLFKTILKNKLASVFNLRWVN